MPIRIEILTSGPAFPDQGSAKEYIHAVSFVTKQVDDAIKEFATHRVDRTTPLKDLNGNPCGSVEILRF